MPFIKTHKAVKRTWRQRLLSWPWRPWQAETITYGWAYVLDRHHKPSATHSERIVARAPKRKPAPPTSESAHHPRRQSTQTEAQRMYVEDGNTFDFQPGSLYASNPGHEAHPAPMQSGLGGDFGGGGASGSWDTPTSSCTASDSTSYDSGSSDLSSSCSSSD